MKTSEEIVRDLIQIAKKELLGISFDLFVYEPSSDTYTQQPLAKNPKEGKIPASNLDEVSAFILSKQNKNSPYILRDDCYYLPLYKQERLLGWFEIYKGPSEDVDLPTKVLTLAGLVSDTVSNLVQNLNNHDLERKNHEMTILSRISQGINITIHFDDMLELIYAQTTQVIPTDVFKIMLFNQEQDFYYYPFYLEHEERVNRKENNPTGADETAEHKIIQTRKAILSNDMELTCQQMEIPRPLGGIRSFIGVPLNSGADTIGCLSIGSTSTTVKYSNRQKETLQAIADQTASAIVKSQLISRMEQRTQQLAKLNEAAKRLNSTLEIEPLLKIILESALQLAGSENGALLLVDEPSGMLTKKVSIRVEGFSASEEEHTVLLTVPLEVNHQVIGAIELLNDQGDRLLRDDDQKYLSAFASQAATAIENARLYTLTDQNLTSRIEELSIMQQIDLELNANIDLEKTLEITLGWAIKYSGFSIGMIGLVNGVELSHWKSNDPELVSQEKLKEFMLTLGKISKTNSPTVINRNDNIPPTFLAKTSTIQLITPIKRESGILGLLAIETSETPKDITDIKAFLSRLSDHATIAISNGQYFNQIKEANLAKSEFVSFVAHELKNPMTSIKGYSELMAAGAVGPLTEAQSGFLNTIRTNVERMRTIVEDLNDITKIEAGRLRLDFKNVYIPDVIETVLNSTKRQAADKKQTIETDLASNLLPIWVDRTRIEQVLINLMSNSIKYTLEGGKIEISAKMTVQGRALLSIKDNGIGINVEDQQKIFSKFFRSEDDRARKSTGAGLGLSITKNLVEMQGGEIWFESQYNVGTTFFISLPTVEK